MHCSQCERENKEGAKFCNECGSKLEVTCAACSMANPPGSKFCSECGSPLGRETDRKRGGQEDKAIQVGSLSAGPELPEADRRQLTVMFCDLVGSTALSEQLDPEELRDVVRAYQEACAEVISRFEGHIAQYLGDGILVYFGYPLAHEDDAQRAVRTGLGIVGAVRELPLLNAQIQVRIGIHTGSVVVGEMGGGEKRERLALGDTLNIASRVQNIAEPNTVLISSATYRLTEGLFECHNLGLHTLKGFSTPLHVYRVLRESGIQSRFEVAIAKGLTPLVGREKEIELLLERWKQVEEGEGQVVLLCGEPGIGKSRLVQVIKERVAVESHARIESRCSSFYQNSSLYPVIDHLHRFLQFRREDSPEEKLGKLEKALEVGTWHAMSLQETVPLFASLLSIPLPDRYPPLNLIPQRQKQKTLEALLAWLLKETERHPVLHIVEDLHWADPSTLEYLSLLIDQVPTTRIFTLLTFRPDFSPPWTSRTHLTQITLNRLARKQVEVMVDKVTGGKTLPAEVFQQLVVRTDGIPLFVEELTKMVLESGLLKERERHYELILPLFPFVIPSSLQDLLMARLDRLGTVKEVAQLGATLGREFTYELLQAVSPLDETTLQKELSKLVEAELLYQRGLPPQSKYFFKHALIQEAAYESLLKSKRQQYHHRIAQILEEQFPETAETQSELLAHHYTEAGLMEQAIDYWQKAGQRAIEHSANVEAINHLTKGLELLKTLSDTPERTQQELDLQTALGLALTATRGYAALEVGKAYARALELCRQAGETAQPPSYDRFFLVNYVELCRQVGETPQIFPVLWGLWMFYLVRAELGTARESAEQLLRLAQSVEDPAFLIEAYPAQGINMLWLGEFTPVPAHMEQGIALYDPQKHRSHAFIYGHDPKVFCLSYAAYALWFLGYPDQALKKSYEALAHAQDLSHPLSLAYALRPVAVVHHFCFESQAAQKWAEALIALSNEQGFAYWLAWGNILRGWALAKQGREEEGIAQIRQGLVAHRATGGELSRPYFLALLAEAYREMEQAEEGLRVLAEALDIVHKNGERFYEAEIYRLKGELLLTLSAENQAEAKACFYQALEVARWQSAKSLKLRAVMSLSRLLQKQGKKEEARRMLAEIYGWFTEGFDTKDLKEAKALLEGFS